MAAETRIGLVVGLAFIVCFALVLSHRGRGDRLSSRMAYHFLTRHSQVDAKKIEPTSAEVGRNYLRERDGAWPIAVATKNAQTQRPQEITTEVDTEFTAAKDPSRGMTLSWEAMFDAAGERTASAVNRLPTERNPTTASSDRDIKAVEGAPPAKQSKSENRDDSARYLVRPGDTLWSIAQAVYGERSKRVVEAIYAANGERMASADALRTGTELMLPSIKGVSRAGNRKNLPTKKATKTSKKRPPAGQTAQPYYQIRPGDRYATIAEHLLGDRSRWREIHELNKDIFPDPGRIRYGVRIRLPGARLMSVH